MASTSTSASADPSSAVEHFDADKLHKRIAHWVQIQRNLLPLIFLEALLHAVHEAAFNGVADHVDGWLPSGKQHVEQRARRRTRQKSQRDPARRHGSSQVDLDPPIVWIIGQVGTPTGQSIPVNGPRRSQRIGASRTNPTAKGRGIAHWIDVFADFDRADDPSVVECDNPQR